MNTHYCYGNEIILHVHNTQASVVTWFMTKQESDSCISHIQLEQPHALYLVDDSEEGECGKYNIYIYI